MRRPGLLGGRGRGPRVPAAPPSDRTRAAYAEIPYPGVAFPQTHPDRLATHARLYGLKPAPPEHCRLLELGCGDGGNLVPMAAALSESEFVGLDLAPGAIALARERAAALGASNAEFAEADLGTLDPGELGRFDYVVAHGVYSWVPRAVADRMLEHCRTVLERQGVAYVSYNALPGGHLRATARDAMRFHARGLDRPDERVGAAREMLAALAEGIPGDDPYRRFSREYAERVADRGDALLFHDDLAPDNRPLLFADFVAEAAAHGLQYLAEADWFEMSPGLLPRAGAELLSGCAADRLAREQYLDFLKCRAFRQTLLCHADLRLPDAPSVDSVRGLLAAAPVRPASRRAEPADRSKVEFRTPKGTTLTTDHPLLKASLLVLGSAWPQRLGFEAVLERAAKRLGSGIDDAGERALADLWLRGYDANVIRLHASATPCASAPGERPRASVLARRQLALGDRTATSLDHETVGLDEPMRRLVQLLDGTRDPEALARELEGEAGGARQAREARQLRRRLDDDLERLAGLALLEA